MVVRSFFVILNPSEARGKNPTPHVILNPPKAEKNLLPLLGSFVANAPQDDENIPPPTIWLSYTIIVYRRYMNLDNPRRLLNPNLLLNILIHTFRNDFAIQQTLKILVRTIINNGLRPGGTNPRQKIQLFKTSSINID